MGKQFDDVSYGDLAAYVANFFVIGYDPDEADPADQTKRLGLDTLFSIVNVPPGILFNGYISVTVSNDDLIVAIKGLDGNNPSSTNPVRVRIGNVEHTLTAALSVTLADGTNWFNAGSTQLATLSVPYFVYLRYNATDGVCIGPSRIAYGKLYSDFSATNTNEKYCGWNDITSATAGDVCENIGYFEATLSAGAGYTWSAPTNVISKPTTRSNWMVSSPNKTGEALIDGYSANPTGANYLYCVDYKDIVLDWFELTPGTSDDTIKKYAVPFAAKTVANKFTSFSIPIPYDNGAGVASGLGLLESATSIIVAYKSAYGAWTGSGNCGLLGLQGRYAIA